MQDTTMQDTTIQDKKAHYITLHYSADIHSLEPMSTGICIMQMAQHDSTTQERTVHCATLHYKTGKNSTEQHNIMQILVLIGKSIHSLWVYTLALLQVKYHILV